MRFWGLTLLTTAVLLATHTGLLSRTGWHAEYAESNVVANEIRWQRFDRERRATVVLVGSSIAGRLPIGAVCGPARPGANLCFDGSNARLGLELLAAAAVYPEWLVVEANTLTLPPSPNETTLRAAFQGFHARLARHLPFLRAEHRPVTLAYSRLKERADRRRAGAQTPPDAERLSLAEIMPGSGHHNSVPGAGSPELTAWLERLRPFQDRGCRVVLIMVPDGGQDRSADLALARGLAARGIPLLDFKSVIPEHAWPYSDGIHLVRPAAEALARRLGRALEELGR
jgi:hypothetical protein